MTSAASGAESLGEGAVQIKFVTKSGTNEWHGGAFVQERNTFLNANTYFNNVDGLARIALARCTGDAPSVALVTRPSSASMPSRT